MVKTKSYTPDRGDLIWVQFNPQAGHEQAGHRPALVLSPQPYNKKTGLLIACPVTTQSKGYPFEVGLPSNLKVNGVVLSDQIKSMDWKARKAQFKCRVPEPVIREVLLKASALIS